MKTEDNQIITKTAWKLWNDFATRPHDMTEITNLFRQGTIRSPRRISNHNVRFEMWQEVLMVAAEVLDEAK